MPSPWKEGMIEEAREMEQVKEMEHRIENTKALTLAIESSCDETSAAVVEGLRTVRSNVVSSQIATHVTYGGVVPEIASRMHIEAIHHVVERALAEADTTLDAIDFLSVTQGPGLVGALLVGVSYAKGLAIATGKDIVGVNHMKGHIASNYITHPHLKPPYIALVVSGGHSYIMDVIDYDHMEKLGETRDDAMGEAYDKVARVLGFGYPGGSALEKHALEGSPTIDFPRVYLEKGSLDFSFSGLKTAVINHINTEKMKGHSLNSPDIARSFQDSIIEVVRDKTMDALHRRGRKIIAISGGVSANTALRKALEEVASKEGVEVYVPARGYISDNAAMIGAAAQIEYALHGPSDLRFTADPNMKL
ncbi:MAG: tRNA (adenosine(37)-N6)-threonylcarbamoyltransferase complex transferase subunit TsaD [Tissierellia bacterium]|nr:tRNA (adenosine(37)-N6)-threonylcarbamoyltransferase complex transferase subunit TsaD [Tissierellia bacterium]